MDSAGRRVAADYQPRAVITLEVAGSIVLRMTPRGVSGCINESFRAR
jgi:hypothetical protein